MVEATSSSLSERKPVIDNNDIEWRIGGKIHFEEESAQTKLYEKYLIFSKNPRFIPLFFLKTADLSPLFF